MQFDYLFTMDNPGNARSYRELLDMATEQIVHLDESGFGTLWQGEHHFGGEGFEINPNPILAGAYVAGITSRLRIGTGAVTPPFWHPLRLAEDLALLDQLSRGRLDIGVARGIQRREATNFHLAGDRADEQRNWRFFLEQMEILKKAWTQEAFSHQGEFWTFPHPGVPDSATWYPRNPLWRAEDGEYIAMSIIPKPYQKPYPALWNLLDKTPGFVTSARERMNVITWLRSREGLREVMTTYQDALSETLGRPAARGEGVSLMRMVYVAETDEQAEADTRELINSLYSYVGGVRPRDMFANPGEKLTDEEQRGEWWPFLYSREHLFIGSPDTVRAQIKNLQDEYGVQRVVLWSWIPGLDQEQVMRSNRLFADEVMPHFPEAAPEPIRPEMPAGFGPLTGD
ncbi:alkanesulfonate monooxygenase SsuD/methylene tetrahydromethanopterin reductase-like flavin-dependent oxidoreductase (luciferase family) [Actinoplanes lutulentus]|uniref:Alkanesulfonate monooxygenase SsuD/methylene tetrahydromethanopterin reductase-like flavin-dependent oxidoreductase (Luciferase family) n=1 Tax=Actinoplanes lutulentus TaxID=1287878 RepID=A0A327YXK7_9ACTN|nr:LLM class flavin-dependent oxidoreductase [Actinoplanes lutulentus]MBB2946503.1 alkanesulfonate monooxygenase SsuD/methylene tetrahydromethanopterin reductase-like flavin-dependent oxidoreductase (luciferase family) [Actinoplanes lutulentus]RAK26421.1 alkanesulfonate monooxygenase SsuD/methylene tetrahydromethanopterin reductase-like flavin-dependent oxidoreductase (luciferase family) [Actinoplanes lutulentus]